MNENSNRQKATIGICVLALILLLAGAFFQWIGFNGVAVLTNIVMGVLWALELCVVLAPDKFSDTVVALGERFWEWLKKEYNELEGGNSGGGDSPFNKEVTPACGFEAISEVSNEDKGIDPVRLPADVKWRMIRKNGIWFMRFSVMRSGSAPLSEEDVRLLHITLQRRITNLLASEYYNLIPFLYYGGNQWDIITVDEVKQSGMDILIDVIWVQDQRIADHLNQKNFGAYIGDTSDAPPVDEDFRND